MTPSEDASPEPADPFLGKVIVGNFRIERLIGSGAMGNVYRAEQLSLGKAVAVKVLHPHLMSDEKLVRRFQREAKSASRLNHPNSIQIIDSGRDADGALYIAMELLTGRDLSQVIRDEFPMPVPRVVRIMSQVLSALDEAHAHAVIHRDLKPSNIMLIERRGEPDFVKVCDYGIAKAHLDESAAESQMLTIQGLVCGTPEYMSPEQARGEPLDGRTDLYSAAVILYQMVTGDIPFRAATPIGIVSRHLSEAPVVPSSRCPDPSIPPDLDDLILRGLAKSRELRPASAAVFREELENIGMGRIGRRARGDQNTVPATPQVARGDGQTMAMAAVATASRRRAGGKPLLAGVLMLAAATAGTMLMRRRRPPGTEESSLAASVSSLAGAALPSVAAPATARAKAEPAPPNNPSPPAARAPAAAPDDDGRPGVGAPAAQPAVELSPAASAASASGARAASLRRPSAATRLASNAATRHGPAFPDRTVTGGASTGPHPDGVAAAPNAPASPVVSAALTSAPPGIAPQDGKVSDGAPGSRSPRDAISEGEKLLSQGEVDEACRRGEEAKRSGPKLAAVYKFLGKCYMRAGDPGRAKENYRRYLELAPGAPDAMFIESIVK